MIRKNIFSTIIALVILFLSFTGPAAFSNISIPDIPHLDKVVHSGLYFIFTLALAVENRALLKTKKNYLILATIPFLFGTAIEILQSLLTNTRTGDFFDACFNLAGILMAIIFWLVLRRVFKLD